MFNLRKLEDRIVLDGAAIAEAIDEIRDHDEHAAKMHHQAIEAHNMQDWDYGLDDADTPLYLADGLDFGHHDTGIHVLVISSDVEDADDLAAAAKENVRVVRYDASDTSAEDVAKLIENALAGQKADSIAFATHNKDGAQLTLSHSDVITAESLESNEAHQDFWKSLGSNLSEKGRIDLLGCNVAAEEEGADFIGKIADLSGADVAASTDATGNEAFGGDWVLETHGINIQHTYFDADKLQKFDGVLANQAPFVAHPITTVQYADQGKLFTFTVPANTFVDPDGDPLKYWSIASMGQRPLWLNLEQESATFTGTPVDQTDTGMQTITVSATDPCYKGAATTFQVFVRDTNEAPLMVGTGIGAQTVNQHSMLTVTVPSDLFKDPDGNALTYTAMDVTDPANPKSLTRLIPG